MDKEKEVKDYLEGKLTREEEMKYEIARELGVLDQVLQNGWKSLSAKETGRIGGLMTRKKKEMKISAKIPQRAVAFWGISDYTTLL